MRFYTLEINGKCRPAVSVDCGKTAYTFASLGIDIPDIASFIRYDCDANLEVLKASLEKADNEKAVDLDTANICAPIMYPDQDVICLGINYNEHATEAAGFSKEAFGGERPYTIYFSKRVSCASGNGDAIPAYEGLVDGLDYEVELGVVLGRNVKDVDEWEAMDSVFGYTIINDVSARNLQTRHKQWYLGKSLDGFTPMGPCIVTPDEIGDPDKLNISCTVNGELRQNSNTGNMIQSVGGAIVELSAGMTLKAGTIIATGTPSGVGMGFDPPRFLKSGDTIICSIEGIGDIVNYVE